MNDDQMLAMDHKLANIFRQKRLEMVESKRTSVVFKLRLLSLAQKLVHRRAQKDVSLYMLPSVLSLISEASKASMNPTLSAKIMTFATHMLDSPLSGTCRGVVVEPAMINDLIQQV